MLFFLVYPFLAWDVVEHCGTKVVKLRGDAISEIAYYVTG